MMSMYFRGITALVAPRISDASGGWKRTSAPTFCSRSAMSPRVPLAMPTSSITIATSTATASTDTAVRVLRCITLAAARLAMNRRERAGPERTDDIIGPIPQTRSPGGHQRMNRLITRAHRLARVATKAACLSPGRTSRLNAARLDYLQISIDNVEPDEVSMKSLRLLEPKLKWLAELAEFSVNVNSVVGGGIKVPEDALVVARRAREL